MPVMPIRNFADLSILLRGLCGTLFVPMSSHKSDRIRLLRQRPSTHCVARGLPLCRFLQESVVGGKQSVWCADDLGTCGYTRASRDGNENFAICDFSSFVWGEKAQELTLVRNLRRVAQKQVIGASQDRGIPPIPAERWLNQLAMHSSGMAASFDIQLSSALNILPLHLAQ